MKTIFSSQNFFIKNDKKFDKKFGNLIIMHVSLHRFKKQTQKRV